MKTSVRRCLASVLLAMAAVVAAESARACPFCNAAMQTLSQEIEAADVALLATLVEPMPMASDELSGPQEGGAKFRVVDVLSGAPQLGDAREIEVVYFGEEAPDKLFFITGLAGVTGPGLDWTTPVPLSDAAVAYVKRLPGVPTEGAERLRFFQDYLEHDDPLLAQDAYDEFARTPYADVVELKSDMDRDQLLDWIQDRNVGPSGRRLYLTMLGICGQPEDVALLEQLMNYDYQRMKPTIAATAAATALVGPAVGFGLLDEVLHAEERRRRESLDALIACYLTLHGSDGLELINELFFGNPRVEYTHLHSAIMALRFHGEETDVLPRNELLNSMRMALDHRDFADQVIPDLTRWEDWEVMPRLVEMFKNSPPDDWIRQPVASYLLVAADQSGEVGEQARDAIAELEELDPATMKRARSLTAFNFLARAAAPPPADGPGGQPGDDSPGSDDAGGAADATSGGDVFANADAPTADATSEDTANQDDGAASESTPAEGVAARTAPQADASAPLAAAPLTPPSKIKIVGVPLVAALVLLGVFAVMLRGADPRSHDESS